MASSALGRTFVVMLALTVFMVTACSEEAASSSAGPTLPPSPQTWTVMVYLHADHNLHPSAIVDLDEMEAALPNDQVRIIYQWDMNESYMDGDVYGVPAMSGGFRGEVAADSVRGSISSETLSFVDTATEYDSDDPDALESFLDWGFTNYAADRYMLVMWDHGGHYLGFGGDEHRAGSGRTGWISPAEIRSAISNSLSSVGAPDKLDVIGFDACLMGGAELLNEFEGLCDYFIACPEIDYGDGWDYQAALGWLRANPGATPRQFCQQEVVTWNAHHSNSAGDLENRSHAAYEMSHVSRLRSRVSDLAAQVALLNSSELNAFVRAVATSLRYGIDSRNPSAPRDYIDLGSLCASIAAIPTSQLASNAPLRVSCQALEDVLDDAVVATSFGTAVAASNPAGLSIYWPNSVDDLTNSLPTYNASLSQHASWQWDEFLSGDWDTLLASDTTAPGLVITTQGPIVNPSVASPATVNFTVTGSDVISTSLMLAEEDSPGVFNIWGHVLSERLDTDGDYYFQYDAQVLTISDGVNLECLCGFFAEPGSDLFFVIASYRSPAVGAPTTAVLLVVDASNGSVEGMLDASGVSPRRIEAMPGGTITLCYLQYDSNNDTTACADTNSTLTVPVGGVSALAVGTASLPPGNYSLLLDVEDYNGNDEVDDIDLVIQ